MKKNKFRQVPGYEGLYGVSSEGKVWSLNYRRSGKIQDLKPGKCRGYMGVELYKD